MHFRIIFGIVAWIVQLRARREVAGPHRYQIRRMVNSRVQREPIDPHTKQPT